MKSIITLLILAGIISCKPASTEMASPDGSSPVATSQDLGQAAVADDVSQKDIVKVAVGSADHTTLVKALQAANLVHVLANAGPFTVFAPVNAAFDKLPAGTLDDLLKPENNSKLAGILQHHVTTSVFETSAMKDGQKFSMADGTAATIMKKDNDVYLDGAKILGSVRASNGIVHVVDAVLLPPQ